MNRKDRRAARSNRATGGGAQGIGPGAMSANLFASAVEHFNAGRLDEAERLCRDVLMFNKGHFDALSTCSASSPCASAILTRRPSSTAARWRSTGAAPNATSTSRRCCAPRAATAKPSRISASAALKRDYVAAHVSLADMLAMQSDSTARGSLRAGARDRSAAGGCRHGLANLLRQLGRLDEAAEQFRQVVALKPDYAEAYSNLGVVLAAQGRFAGSRRALSARALNQAGAGRRLSQPRPRPAGRRARGRGRGGDHARPRDRRDRRSQGDLRSVRTVGGERRRPERRSAISSPAR